jgi:hypothetical protein
MQSDEDRIHKMFDLLFDLVIERVLLEGGDGDFYIFPYMFSYEKIVENFHRWRNEKMLNSEWSIFKENELMLIFNNYEENIIISKEILYPVYGGRIFI